MPNTRPNRRLAALCLLLASCAPPAGAPGSLPATAGAYPRDAGSGPASLARRSAAWEPAEGVSAQVRIDALPAAFFAALPAPGAHVPVRASSWPAPVRLTYAGDAGATLHGDPVAADALAEEIRCGVGPHARASVRLVAELVERTEGLVVGVRFGGQEPLECELSSLGRRRLQGAAADVYLWARQVARAGTELPAAYP